MGFPEIEIDKMVAGYELDTLIELHVYGIEYVRGYASMPYSTEWEQMGNLVDMFRFGKHKQANGADSVACVVEMVVSDWDFGGGDCECTIYSPSLAKVTAVANSMPLAVARCALKVVVGEPTNSPSNPEIQTGK